MTPVEAGSALSSIDDNKTVCPVCASESTELLLEMRNVPVLCNRLCQDVDSALQAPTGDIDFTFCRDCGHAFNSRFDPSVIAYDENYETSLHYSPHFREFVGALAERLIASYGLREKTVVEIGCGQGEFLIEICQRGGNRGYGFDQSFDPKRTKTPEFVTFSTANFGEDHAHLPTDLLCCRHVLEHIPKPDEFLQMIQKALSQRTDAKLYIEVPNGLFTLRDLGIWDLIYEHCSYYWAGSLMDLMAKSDFGVLRVATCYDGQFLSIDLDCSKHNDTHTPFDMAQPETLADVTRMARSFGDRFREKKQHWMEERQRLAHKNQRAVIWGAGSKGVTFLNLTQGDTTLEHLGYAVDISPRKHGKFIPGTGQKIVPPSALSDIQPDVIFLMNATYGDEIRNELKALGISSTLLVV